MPWSATSVYPSTSIGTISRSKRHSSVARAPVPVDVHRHYLPLEAPLLGRLVREPVRADGELVELGAGDLPLIGDHLGAEALADDVVLGHQLGREGVAEVLLRLHPGGEG